jgi:GNAT superfamily N-acetyltransferase
MACDIARPVSRNNGVACRSRGAQGDDMPDANDLSQFHQQSALRDGTPVVIRFVRPDDKERLVTAFSKLDPETIYTRFFSVKKELTQAELDRLDTPDPEHRIGLVVTLGSGVDETIIAGASCVVLDTPGPTRSAEVAFTVEEDYQRQGLASKLLATIVDIARSRGIGRLEADVLAGNQAMLVVFQRSGLPMSSSRSEGVVHLIMDLTARSPRDSGAGKE